MIIIIAMIVFFFIGVPIAFTLGAVGILAIYINESAKIAIAPLMIFNGSEVYSLIAIPLFILMGELMHRSSLANKIIDFAGSLVGFVKGGLGMATIVAGMGMAAISGSSVADAAALGSVMIPQMEKHGYSKPISVAIVSVGATIAQIIPPSITFILYGVIAGVSIGRLFIAGFLPGIIMGVFLMLVIYRIAIKNNLPIISSFNFKRIFVTFKDAFLSLLLPIIVIGGILGGFFTPTEAGAAGVTYALLLSMLIYREINFRALIDALRITAKRSAIVLLMVGASALLGWFLVSEQIPLKIANLILSISESKFVIILLMDLLLLIAGMFLHGTPLIIIFVPITVPIAKMIGLDLIQFGIMFAFCISIGQVTPPVASVLMTTSAIGEIDVDKIVPCLMPLLLAMILVLLLVSFMSGISTFLPNLLM